MTIGYWKRAGRPLVYAAAALCATVAGSVLIAEGQGPVVKYVAQPVPLAAAPEVPPAPAPAPVPGSTTAAGPVMRGPVQETAPATGPVWMPPKPMIPTPAREQPRLAGAAPKEARPLPPSTPPATPKVQPATNVARAEALEPTPAAPLPNLAVEPTPASASSLAPILGTEGASGDPANNAASDVAIPPAAENEPVLQSILAPSTPIVMPSAAPIVKEASPVAAPPAPIAASPAPIAPPVSLAGDAPNEAPPAGPAPIALPKRVASETPSATHYYTANTAPSPAPIAMPPVMQSAQLTAPVTLDCPPVNPIRCGVQCDGIGCAQQEPSWAATRPIPWQVFAQGEYVGPARIAHMPEYRLRVDDTIEFIYRLSGTKVGRPYRVEVGDRIRVNSLSGSVAEQDVVVQPDGTVTLSLLGQVPASGRTIEELRGALDDMYLKFIKAPNMAVVPVKFNTRLEELRASVDARAGIGGQRATVKVTPEGSVQLTAIGSVYVQGLTLGEVKREVDERYAQMVDGLDVTPVLANRAPRFVFVLGEVRAPGRYVLEGPTTAMQAIAMAGSWNVGADMKRLVVFRRDDCWQLMATKLDLHGAVFGKKPCPTDEIWLRDSDIVLVPKSSLLATDDLLSLLFTRGLYAVMPVSAQLNFSKLSTL